MKSSSTCVPGTVLPDSSLTNGIHTPTNVVSMDPVEDIHRLRNVTLSKSIGSYGLRGDLGSGNFSRVKMGIHHPTRERVAIKILDKTKLDEKTRRMLAREIATMEGICHPHVIRLFEVVETYARIYLVTEYASGGELFEKISAQGRFKEEEAKPLYVQILSAVKFMHSLGFIHRDIKAENVFFAEPGLIKLGDFGFSTRLTEGPNQVLKTFCGSPPYAAPELFRDESYLGPYVDIWALGILLYLVVTGTMPFRARTVIGLKTLILEGNFVTPDHVSLPCKSLISTVAECIARWNTLRERYAREKRLTESETRSGAGASKRTEWVHWNAMCFLNPHVRLRKSIDNFQQPASNSGSISSATLSLTSPNRSTSSSAEDDFDLLLPPNPTAELATCLDGVNPASQVSDISNIRIVASCPPEVPSTSARQNIPSTKSAAASLPYFGSAGRCKRQKPDETMSMFKDTLANLRESMKTPAGQISTNDADELIGQSVTACLRNMSDKVKKMRYRRMFRDLVQDCEEATLDE